ncbi:MAG: ABC transporter ATP-binding protein [Oscillospiraceae bacterium]|nr:ABC transporter ATP-binding protein [Oscillospiraceae bacterium]
MSVIIEIKNLIREFKNGDKVFRAVDDVNLTINDGEFVLLLGDSGAGKSTLLNILGGLDTATSGSLCVTEHDLATLNERELNKYRREVIGFVFQFYNLISALTVIENVEIVKGMTKVPLNGEELLEYLGLSHRRNHFPSQMSGGEQQRCAIARALYKNPDILLCDEPTGALDYENSKNILALLQKINRENKKTIIMVTHNNALEPIASKIVKMKSGKITEVIVNENPVNVENLEW